MYEIAVALNYLIPKRRQLSVSIISIISILVISVVVWLSIVFFSVEESIEKRWAEKLVAVTAPIRIHPRQAYYASYYYNIDTQSQESNYLTKTISEKLTTAKTDPYNPEIDSELPPHWPKPLLNSQGEVKDLVKDVVKAIDKLKMPGVAISPFDMAYGQVKVQLLRRDAEGANSSMQLSQAVYFVSYDALNPNMGNSMLAPSNFDIENLISDLSRKAKNDPESLQLLAMVLNEVKIESLATPFNGWQIAPEFIQDGAKLNVHYEGYNRSIDTIWLGNRPSGSEFSGYSRGILVKKNGILTLTPENNLNQPIEVAEVAIRLAQGQEITCLSQSIDYDARELSLQLETVVQGQKFQGKSGLDNLLISKFQRTNGSKILLRDGSSIPKNAVILPKTFYEGGALVGDSGKILYQSASGSGVHQMSAPIFIDGFYDPGMLPLGGRLVFVRPELIARIQSSIGETNELPSGFNVYFTDISRAHDVKAKIESALKSDGLSEYWSVVSYDEFDFTRDIFQQMRSDRNLFSLIAIIIMIVASSNIVSMLIILVRDKRKEIAILRALGATRASVGFIFGFSGFLMGTIGSIIGWVLAYATLKNLTEFLQFLGSLQGFEVLNAAFYGESITSSISLSGFLFTIAICAIMSMVAGIIPALQAARQNTVDALRSE